MSHLTHYSTQCCWVLLWRHYYGGAFSWGHYAYPVWVQKPLQSCPASTVLLSTYYSTQRCLVRLWRHFYDDPSREVIIFTPLLFKSHTYLSCFNSITLDPLFPLIALLEGTANGIIPIWCLCFHFMSCDITLTPLLSYDDGTATM